MKATIQSTTSTVELLDCEGRPFMSRVWEGVTEAGIPFTAYIAIVQVRRDVDNTAFARELQENKSPSEETRRAISLRFVI